MRWRIAPLAFMRGRTLNQRRRDPGQAQEHHRQMRMFQGPHRLWRQAVVTGDVSQVDTCPRGAPSGLVDAERVLKRVEGTPSSHFTSADVVRHPLVARHYGRPMTHAAACPKALRRPSTAATRWPAHPRQRQTNFNPKSIAAGATP